MGADLGRLLDRCRRGDDRAWRSLVDATSRLVYSVVRRHGLHTDDAEDAYAATYRALHGQLDRLESGESIPRWLAVTAARQAMRVRRASQRYTNYAEPDELEALVADEDRAALETAIAAERAMALHAGLNAMDDRCRQLLTALFVEDAEYADLAARMAIPIGSIGPTRVRCLEKLRRILTKSNAFAES